MMFPQIQLHKITQFFGRLPYVFSHSLQFRVRLLPLVIFCAVLMLSVRLFNIKKQLEGDDGKSKVKDAVFGNVDGNRRVYENRYGYFICEFACRSV